MKLSQRLHAIKEYLPHGLVVADIGADRGELSLCLLKEGIAQKVILADISEKSLSRAKEFFAEEKEEERAEFRIGDGLSVLAPKEADYAVVAGMGGPTICEILSDRPGVTAALRGLVIQAMGNSDKVRALLNLMGFRIAGETMIFEEGQYYIIIHAVPGEQVLSPTDVFAGPCLLARKDPLLMAYLKEEQAKAQAILIRLKKRGKGRIRQEELNVYLKQIEIAKRRMEGHTCF